MNKSSWRKDMENKEISHVEIYYEDSSMYRICNDEKSDKKPSKKQIEWIIDECLNELNNFKNCSEERKVTISNYNTFNEDLFPDLPHSEYQMLISLLNTFK